MCYNISITSDLKSLEKRFDAKFTNPGKYKPRYHASSFSAPYLPVISNENSTRIQFFRWGLIPHWVKDKEAASKVRFKTANARSETVFDKASFREAIRNKRCLVLADGFYEWREFKGKKYPYYISLTTQKPFSMAGIWDLWQDEEAGTVEHTFSIITTNANPLLEVIHNTKKRMPVILEKELEKKWLSESPSNDEISAMLTPYDEKKMQAHPVSRLITTRRANTDVPEVLQEHKYPELEEPF